MNLYTFSVGSVVLLIKLYLDFYEAEDLRRTLSELSNDSSLPRIRYYDFIIVGGGGAGCVLANRLSKFYSVLLLEAGGTPVPATDALIHYYATELSNDLNFQYKSVPQPSASQIDGGVITSHAGRMLGGSTSHNGLVFNRGHKLDFDNWAKLTKDPSWKYQNVLKYFKRLEKYVGPYDNNGGVLNHGNGGPMLVDTILTPLEATWLEAGAELGFQARLDPNAPQVEEFAAVARSQQLGRRVSTYTAYIKRIEGKRKTLRIERYSTVQEILINKTRAYGVAYLRHGIPQLAHATKEIIVSCGAFGSPLLLMKSGIGPARVLKEAGIPLVKDLPVGIGIREHPGVTLYPVTVESKNSSFPNMRKDFTEYALMEWQEYGKGPLSGVGAQGQAFIVSSKAKENKQGSWPDIQFQIGEALPPPDNEPDTTPPKYWFAIIGGRPKSTGSISLNATAYKAGNRSDEALGILDYALLQTSPDADVLLEGVKLAMRVLENTTAFSKFGTKFENPSWLPACASFTFKSDEYWRCFIKQLGTKNYHVSSSCRMGYGRKDKGAVLDSKFNVLGVSGLKVVDASSMPEGPNANPTAPVVMMAEKAAEEILLKWSTKIPSPNDVDVEIDVSSITNKAP